MNKKTKKKFELEEAMKAREVTVNDCPVCRTHFYSPLAKEAHKKLHPDHFKEGAKAPAPDPSEAIPQQRERRGRKKDVDTE